MANEEKSKKTIPKRMNPLNKTGSEDDPKKRPRLSIYWVYGIIFAAIIGYNLYRGTTGSGFEIENTQFYTMLKQGDVDQIKTVGNKKIVRIFIKQEAFQKNDSFYKNVFGADYDAARKLPEPQAYFSIIKDETFAAAMLQFYKDNPDIKQVPDKPGDEGELFGQIVSTLLPILLIGLLFIMMMRKVGAGGGGGGPGGIFNIGKSKATLFDKGAKVNINFGDVAGLDEAKVEVMEIVDFLKTPKKYTALGGKIPKGALLIGPPGTGKTLLAKAMAGEAQVPFFSLSGSDFVEMFVGVGAGRVRDLFKQAREKAPCIIFIDEIDAIGRARGKNNMVGGNDERENTLNQLLVEMDGFGTDSGIIILAATNRPDVLDSALLRPGRFDRQVSIDKPDLIGREQIFKVHLKPVKLAEGVDAKKLSAQTPGFAGAEIANVCNEAALIAARKNKEAVDMLDFQDAIDRVIGGLEKKNTLISPEEKRVVAYHEAGHAIAGWFLEHTDPLVKVSIVPRGVASLGYAQYLPKEQFLYTIEQLEDGMCMTLGGRVAEDITFGKISTGAQNDLERITKLAYAMVTIYGMNDKVGNVSFNDTQGEYQFNKPYSEKTSELIDQEVRNQISEVYEMTKKLLIDKREGLIKLADKLLEKEILFQSDLEEILGKRPFEHRTTYDEFVNGPAADQEHASKALVPEGVADHSGTFNRNPEEKDASVK